VVLLDHSLGMLRAARGRLEELARDRTGPLVLLQADLQDLPFREGTFETILSMGVLHLFPDPEAVLAGLGRVLAPGGKLFLSSLVLGRRWGNGYLRVLHLGGEVGPPRSASQVEAMVRRHVPGVMRLRQKGNMVFVEAGPT
jgi:SAM-dependent methyltransferase